ncbi:MULTISPECIES: transposase [unclassified Nocardiopsis]|uniref:transposase n=1 Tax=unclassified Nocardiopsis TaxID=2649073 RepID=UPI001359FC81
MGRPPQGHQRDPVPHPHRYPWRDLPERYGPWESAAGRHRGWCTDGTWQRIADRLRIDASNGEELLAGIAPACGPTPAAPTGTICAGEGSKRRSLSPAASVSTTGSRGQRGAASDFRPGGLR